MRAEPGRVEAVLDWEMATVGDPLVDLGCVMCYWPEAGDPPVRRDALSAITTLPGWFTRAQLVERYARITGRDVSGLGYYEVFGIFKIAVVLQQIYFRYHRGQTQDERFRNFDQRVRGLVEIAAAARGESRLSSLYLIRHGQAGTRGHYDALSDLGRRQAYLLGQYLAAQKVPFKAFIAGCLNRQRQTAEEVWRAYREAGVAVPDIVSDPNWNEFDMTAVFAEFAPLLSEADPRSNRITRNCCGSWRMQTHPSIKPRPTATHRRCAPGWKAAIPAARNRGRPFGQRVLSARASWSAYQSGDAVAIFTSATPIAIWVASALGVSNGHIMRLAGVLYNSAITTMRLRDDGLMLFSFNGVPHLYEPQLRTFR